MNLLCTLCELSRKSELGSTRNMCLLSSTIEQRLYMTQYPKIHWHCSNGNIQSRYAKRYKSLQSWQVTTPCSVVFTSEGSSEIETSMSSLSLKTSCTHRRCPSLAIYVLLRSLIWLNAWLKGLHRICHQNHMPSRCFTELHLCMHCQCHPFQRSMSMQRLYSCHLLPAR